MSVMAPDEYKAEIIRVASSVTDFHQTFTAMRLHFQGKFDYHRYNGKIKTRDSLSQAQLSRFRKIAAMEDPVLYMAANLRKNPRLWITDFGSDESREVYQRALGYSQAASYRLKSDLENLTYPDFNANLCARDGACPPIYNQMRQGSISVETVALLDRVTGFLARTVPDDPTYADASARVSRYGHFIPVSDGVVKAAIVKIFPNGRRES